MPPLSEDYLLSPCEVKSLDNFPILTGYFSRIREESIQIAGKTDKLPIIHCNTIVKISVFNSASGFRVLTGRVYLSTPDFIRIVDVQSEADFEKRNFFRVRVDIPACARMTKNERDAGQKENPEAPFSIRVQDLSLSGMSFVSSQPLAISDRITINLKLPDTVVSLPCKIVRKIKAKQTGPGGYGCEFLDNSGRQYDLLCKYLFDRQREQISKIKQDLT